MRHHPFFFSAEKSVGAAQPVLTEVKVGWKSLDYVLREKKGDRKSPFVAEASCYLMAATPNPTCQRFQISSIGWMAISNRITTPVTTTSLPVSTTTSYSLTAWLRGENDPESGERAWEVRAAYYNSAGAFISEQAVAAEVLAPSTWTQKGGNFTTPNNASTVRVHLLY
ncbi:MAG: hypothetical protein U0175_22420 [Caldilineaceae bacterium]